jgi:hypothetical protein
LFVQYLNAGNNAGIEFPLGDFGGKRFADPAAHDRADDNQNSCSKHMCHVLFILPCR